MKIGILGTGIGVYHAKLYNKLVQAEKVILYGRNLEKLDKIREELGIQVTDRIEEILEDPEIDLVDICLPCELHKEYTIKALAAGKHVFCETPFALTMEDAHEMIASAKQYNKEIYVNMFIRFEPACRRLVELTRDGSLGALKSLHLSRKTPPMWGDLGLYRIPVHLMIHEFDLIGLLLGKPDRIMALGNASVPEEANVDVLLGYSDTYVTVHASSMMPDAHPFTVSYEAIFEHGTLEFVEDGYADRVEGCLRLFTNEKEERYELSEENCFEHALAHVLECCAAGKPSILGICDAADSLAIALEVQAQIV